MSKYNDAVTEARTLVKRSEADQWRLAELSWEQVEAGKSAAQWGRDVGFSESKARVLVRIWRQFGQHAQVDRPSFYEAYELTNNGGQYEGREGISSRHQETAKGAVRNMPPEEKAAVVREALADPDVTDRVLRDPATRANVVRGQGRAYEDINRDLVDRINADPVLRVTQQTSISVEIEKDITLARFRLAEATRKLTELQDRDQAVMERFGRAADGVGDALEWLRVVIRGGMVDDAALAALLDGGES